MFLAREGIEPEPSPRPWAGNVEGTGANAKSWFDRLLAGMVEAGLGIPALCLYLSLAEPELLARVARLDLAVPHNRPMRRAGGRNPWTAAEIRHLIQLWGEGIHVARIAEALGRSRGGIYAKKRRLGLPARDRKSLVDRDPLAEADVRPGQRVEGRRDPQGAPAPGWARKPGATSPLSESIDAPEVVGRGGAAGLSPKNDKVADESSGRSVGRKRADRKALAGREGAPEGADTPTERDLGSVRTRTASPELLAAIDQARKLAKKAYTKEPAEWSRSDWSETEVLELALRSFAGQTRFGIARDMGISVSAAKDRLTRIGMGSVWGDFRRKGLKNDAGGFDVGLGLDRMRNLRAVARVCGIFKALFFVGERDRKELYYCPEWHRNFSPAALERKARREIEKAAKPKKVKATGRRAVTAWADGENGRDRGYDACLDQVLAEALENFETELLIPPAAPCAVAAAGGLVQLAGETPIEWLGGRDQRELAPIEMAPACTGSVEIVTSQRR